MFAELPAAVRHASRKEVWLYDGHTREYNKFGIDTVAIKEYNINRMLLWFSMKEIL